LHPAQAALIVDVLRAAGFLRRTGAGNLRLGQIMLVGHSMGGGISVLVAGMLKDVVGVAAEAPAVRLPFLLRVFPISIISWLSIISWKFSTPAYSATSATSLRGTLRCTFSSLLVLDLFSSIISFVCCSELYSSARVLLTLWAADYTLTGPALKAAEMLCVCPMAYRLWV
jgi:pimeloyl-ACP methyl ester carboxylesterase